MRFISLSFLRCSASLLLIAIVSWNLPAQTLVLQPGPSNGVDAIIANCVQCGYDNANFGAAADMLSCAWTNDGAESDCRSLIRFDISSIPPGSIVTSAFLSIYYNPVSSNGNHEGDNISLLQRVTSSWDENTVTWDNQPTSTSTDEVVMPATVSNTEDRPDINVTVLVQGMVDDPANNFGLLFRQQDETAYRRMVFASSDHPDALLHPKLVVNYVAPNVDCITLTPGPNEGQDAVLASCVSCGYNDMNFGSDPDLASMAWTNGSAESDLRSLMRFDLSTIPTTATVVSATLSLYFNPNSSNGNHQGDNTSFLQRVTSTWDENTVTWDTQPSTTTVDEVLLPATSSNTENRPDINVTAPVQDMLADPLNDFGFMLLQQDETSYRKMIFASSDYPNAALRPSLMVCYTNNTGLSDPDRSEKLSVFPVPMSQNVTIDLMSFARGAVDLTLWDINGRCVRTLKAAGGEKIRMERGSLSSGLYVLAAHSDHASMFAKLVIE